MRFPRTAWARIWHDLEDIRSLGLTVPADGYSMSSCRNNAEKTTMPDSALMIARRSGAGGDADGPPMGAFAVKRACCPDPVTWRSSGCAGVLAFFAAAWVPGRRAVGVKLERPQPVAPVRARARTYELDAGKRGPMITGGESQRVVVCRGRGVRWGVLASRGSVRESGGVVSHPPIRPPAGGRGHDHVIRGPGCSVSSSSASGNPAQVHLRARPGPCDRSGAVTAPLSGAR